MAPELQKYYEDRFDMFVSDGWKDLIEDVFHMAASLEQIETIKTFEELKFRQGQLDILNWILTLKKVSEETYDELLLEGK